MLPEYFVQLETLPVTSNGKTDKKALLAYEGLRMSSDVEYIAPRNEVEKELAEIWAEILGIEKELISVNSNFFELGGHSLKATTLSLKIDKVLQTKVPLTEIFQRPTLGENASFIENIRWIKENDSETRNLKEIEI